jgi:alkylhydroperoxidase/carboxymuconolactone decarboxylase family protein YurZ
MMKEKKNLPDQYVGIRKSYKAFLDAVENLGKAVREEGPIDVKTAHLVQLAASVAIRSEGAVHSHCRRALEAGAKPEEIRHAVILLTSTIGFPTVSAALSWIDDIIEGNK